MHAMQPPQRRHGMKEDMLEIDREVEDDDRGNDADPRRKRHQVEQAPSARFGKESKADGGGRKYKADEQRVRHHDAEIVGPAPAASDRLFASWPDEFPDRHHGEDAAEGAQADIGLVGE